jgi:hypothetical protein
MRDLLRLLLFFSVALCAAIPAHAQESGVRLSGNFAGVFGEDHTNMEAGGTVGYRFTPHVGFDFEVLVIPDLEFDEDGIRRLPTLFPIPSFDVDSDGRAVAFLANFVGEFPSPARWLLPYVEGGGGLANVSQSVRFRILPATTTTAPGVIGRIRDLPRGMLAPIETRRAETDLALTVGGGVDFRIWRGFAIGPSIRYIRLFGTTRDRDLTRIGARASYRF